MGTEQLGRRLGRAVSRDSAGAPPRITRTSRGTWMSVMCRAGCGRSGSALSSARSWSPARHGGPGCIPHPARNPQAVIWAGVAYSETGKILDTAGLRRLSATQRGRDLRGD